jgi:phosphoserine phosphatase RsbU/P
LHQAFLVTKAGESPGHAVPVGTSLVLGRAGDCDVVVNDAAASRRHLEIYARGGEYRWRDLGSTNGTLINGLDIRQGMLDDGDELQIGQTIYRFELKEIVEKPREREDSTIVHETLVDWQVSDLHPTESDNSDALLRAVYAVVNEISSNYDPCGLVDNILKTTVKAIHAQRGAVFFAQPGQEELLPCPVCEKYHLIQDGKLRHAERGEIRISGTVAHSVLSDGESVIYQDGDPNIAKSDSIMSLDLRSIICVPVRGKYDILGILYADSDREGHEYTHGDMLLATAVGNSAGLAMENATLHVQMLDKQRTDQEIEHAWTIQKGFLIDDWPVDDPRFAVYGETKPAKTVGGDFFDCVRPKPDRMGILVGDVSGKGVPAALAMAQVLAEFRLCARADGPPTEVLTELNESMYRRSQRGMFCTVCYVTLDLDTGLVRCANAGHLPGIWVGQDGAEFFGNASGPPAGVLPFGAWTISERVMKPGEALVLFTDGIIEARSGQTRRDGSDEPDEYGMESLRRFASGLYGRPPKYIIEAVIAEVAEFCSPSLPYDDCTMIAFSYQGEKA